MHITTHLDVDLLALDRDDDVTCLVQLTAPVPAAANARPGQGLVVVLDRSGSMAGPPLAAAIDAICSLVRRLAPQDSFGLVTFDDEADVVVPMRSMAGHDAGELESAIRGVSAGGSTDLSSGYLLGLREAARVAAQRSAAPGPAAGATVLLVSDGHANAGLADPVVLGGLAATAHRDQGIVTSTIGFGLGYDEVLLEAITRGGSGEHRFAPDVDACIHAIAETVTGLLAKSATGAQLRITPRPGMVGGITVRNDLPHWLDGDALVVGLGDLYAGEERRTLFRLHVPAVAALGLATIADVVMEFTSLPDLKQHTLTIPLVVNVVPGDQAAGRMPDPLVEVEELLVEVDQAKKSVAASLRAGDAPSARRTLSGTISRVGEKRTEVRSAGAVSLTGRLDEAAEELLRLSDDVLHRSAEHASKSVMTSYAATSRGRTVPRQAPATGATLGEVDGESDEDGGGGDAGSRGH